MIVALARELKTNLSLDTHTLLIIAAVILVLGVGASYAADVRTARATALEEERAALAADAPFDPFAGGFPVPPMPGQQAQPSRLTGMTIRGDEQ